MKKKLSIMMAAIMILTVMVSGCSTQGGNQVGSVPDGTVAILTSAKGTEYFDTFSEPWGRANDEAYSGSNCTLTLLKDWVAVDGSLGEGYFFTNGALTPREREDDDTWLIVDLNGHTIDRGLSNQYPRDNGCIFYLGSGSDDVNIKIMNGTLTGGNNNGNGGAICNDCGDPSCLELINLEIKNNKSQITGGGIAVLGMDVRIIDTKITNNRAEDVGGGVYGGSANITLEGNVVINNNDSKKARNNLYLSRTVTIDCSKLSENCSKKSIGISKDIIKNASDDLAYLGSNGEKLKDIFSLDMVGNMYVRDDYLWYTD